MRTRHRITIFAVAFFLLLQAMGLAGGFFSISVLASDNTTEFAGGDGTELNPYRVAAPAHLDNVRLYMNACFIQTQDIDMTAFTSTNGWRPIGKQGGYDSNPFTGTYDGGGHVINGLKVQSRQNSGLFEYSRGTVKNLGMTGFSAASYSYVGVFVVYNEGTVNNCYNTGAVSASSIGGIVYSNQHEYDRFPRGIIENCYNSGELSAGSSAAGIAVENGGTIKNCYNTANITLTYNNGYAGGIAENNTGGIEKCYNTGTLFALAAGYNIGGIAGSNGSSWGTIDADFGIRSCYNAGDIVVSGNTVKGDSGGIAGYNTHLIKNCYNTGNISGSAYNAGGIAGTGANTQNFSGGITPFAVIVGGEIENCYNAGFVSAKFAGGIAGEANKVTNSYTLPEINFNNSGVKLSVDEMKNQGSFNNFDFTGIWAYDAGSAYKFPVLQGLAHIEQAVNTAQFGGGNGKLYNPYKVTTAQHLNNIRNNLSACFIQTGNINLTGATGLGGPYYDGGKGWNPISNAKNASFCGNYNGGNYNITGMKINRSSPDYNVYHIGLFGYNIGVIKNIGIKNGEITGPSYCSAGAVAGYSNGVIQGCFNESSVSASNSAGGIVGEGGASGAIISCYNNGAVAGSYTGGILGEGNGASGDAAYIRDCYNIKDFSFSSGAGSVTIGGITGWSSNYRIENCYNTGNISIYDGNAGGISGTGTSVFENCYNTGNITVTGTNSSGGGISAGEGTFNNCQNSGNISAFYSGGIALSVSAASNCVNEGDVSGYQTGGIASSLGYSSTITDCKNGGNISTDSDGGTIGGIVGTAKGGSIKITRCENTGTVSGGSYTGGIAGDSYGCEITDCRNAGSIIADTDTWSNKIVGGITGSNQENTITNCYNTGAVSAVASNSPGGSRLCLAGGIAGEYYNDNNSSIMNCYNTGKVSSVSTGTLVPYAGGLVGYNTNYGGMFIGVIRNSYNAGVVEASSTKNDAYAGGIAGYNMGKIDYVYNLNSIHATALSNAYAGGIAGHSKDNYVAYGYNIGEVAATAPTVNKGALIGKNEGSTLTYLYFAGLATDRGIGNENNAAGKAEPKTHQQMKTKESLEGFDFEYVWGMLPTVNNGYPVLRLLPGDEGDITRTIKNLSVTANKYTFDIELTNSSFKDIDQNTITVFAALYKNGKMVGLKMYSLTDLASEETTTINASIDASEQADTIKILCWTKEIINPFGDKFEQNI